MKRLLLRRLEAVEHAIGSIPIPQRTVEAAFAEFRQSGALPDDQRLAHRVTVRATCGYAIRDTGDAVLDSQWNLRAALNTPTRADDPVMAGLYKEAVWAGEPLRSMAREVLSDLASLGLDVSKPLFAGRKIALPSQGGVALYFHDFPGCLAQSLHEDRVTRLRAWCTELYDRVGVDDERWFEALRDAESRFQRGGERPRDPLLWEAMLVTREFLALLKYSRGEDVAAELAAVDADRATSATR